MIYGIFHKGSGLGNQLHRYVGIRCLALDKGEDFGMVAPDLFKGKDFMNIDIDNGIDEYSTELPSGKVIPTSTIIATIDGEFQAETDFIHHIDEVREWLKVEPLEMPNDLCVINFRGGEYVGVADLFLPQEYWDLAIKEMLESNPKMRFEVHTDDIEAAIKILTDLLPSSIVTIVCNIEKNWRSIRYAKYLILSNSSFAILPALLNQDVKKIIAPKYWAGYNKGYWQLEDNNYKKFTYLHHED